MVVPPVDHDCVLKEVVVEQANEIAKLKHEMEQIKKALLGSRSERSKMPRIKTGPAKTPKDRQRTREERAAAKAQVPEVTTHHPVPPEQRKCTSCGNDKLTPLGAGKTTTVWEFVPARFVRHVHVQEVLRCRCNGFVVTAPGAPKVIAKGRYGASFLAHLVVAKCADHLPLYRLEKDFARQGIPIARSTMNELLHSTSSILQPVWSTLLDVIRVRPVVMADETRLRMLKDEDGKPKNGFVWTFGAYDDQNKLDVSYKFAADRAGDTPKETLAGTSGVLLADSYSGYNVVAEVSGRRRAACHAHLRRYFHESLKTAPVAQELLDLVAELYRTEHQAPANADEHFEFRKLRVAYVHDRIKAWLDEHRDRHPPKSPIAIAIRYALNHWTEFRAFLDDPRIPLDNNASERSLRRVALGRKNYLFVGNLNAGQSLAGLYSLVATCEARSINPFEYLADVIPQVQDYPAARLAELLPGAWSTSRA
jgi:transposase